MIHDMNNINNNTCSSGGNIEHITIHEFQQCIVTASGRVSTGTSTTSGNISISSQAQAQAAQHLDVLRSNHPILCMTKCLELLYMIIDTNVNAVDNISEVFYVMSSFQICLRKSGNFALNNHDDFGLSPSLRRSIREAVFAYVSMICDGILLYISTGRRTDIDGGGFDHLDLNAIIPSFIRTKISVVLVQCLHLDYPQYWPNAFDEIVKLLLFENDQKTKIIIQGSTTTERNMLKDLYVRICEAISEEIIVFRSDRSKAEVDRNNLIKNAMKSNDSQIINELIRGLVGTFHESRDHQNNNYLPNLVLSVMKRYLGWIDWEIIAKEEYNILPLMFKFIGEGGQLALESSDCLLEILDRSKHDQLWNIKLCARMNLFSVLNNIDLDDNIDLSIKAAEITAIVGISLLENLEKVPNDAQIESFIRSKTHPTAPYESSVLIVTQLQSMLDMFWRCFAYDDIDVTSAIMPLAMRLTGTLDKQVALSRKQTCSNGSYLAFSAIEHFPQLLSLIYQQMQYPEGFQFDYNDEDDAEEQLFRTKLYKLLQIIVRVLPNEALHFICNALSSLSMPLSSAKVPPVEASLQLVFHYCDGLSTEMTSNALKEGPFHHVIIALHQSDIALHHHHEVVILYYEIMIRYAQVLKYQPDLLTNILLNISGANGIQHTHARVRSRSCYLLLRLVKAMGPVLRPYVETAVVGIQGRLFYPLISLLKSDFFSFFFISGLLSSKDKLVLQTDDFLYLFETTGLLLGSTELSEDAQIDFLVKVLTPNIQSMEDIVSSGNLKRDPEHYGGVLADLIASVAHISKGFSQPCQKVKSVMTSVVPIILKSLQALPSSDKVRSKTMITLHRLIFCIGLEILPLMDQFLTILVDHCNDSDISDVSQLLNQLCSKFKGSSANTLNIVVIPFLKKCHELIPNELEIGTLAPHLQTEQISIKKLSFVFLQYLVSKKVASVLLSPVNLPQLEYILNEMKNGAVSMVDPAINKTCLVFFRGLIDQWIENENNSIDKNIQNGVIRFVCDVLLHELLGCIFGLKFDEKDALQSRVILEVAKLLSVLKSKRKDEFDQVLAVKLSRFGDHVSSFENTHTYKEINARLKELIISLRESS